MARGSRPLLCALLVCCSTAASGAPIFTASAEGDWFDGASWDTGVAPTISDAPTIDNGGTAEASSASPLYPGAGTAVTAAGLAIGSRTDPSMPVDASGALELADVDLLLTGDLAVGVVDLDNDDPAGTASGSLSAFGADEASGNVTVGGATRIGVMAPTIGAGPEGSSVTGALAVGGDFETGILQVGSSGERGSASGEGTVVGDAQVIAGSVSIGSARRGFLKTYVPDTLEMSTSGLVSVGGDLETMAGSQYPRTVEVGVSYGARLAEGRLDVGGDLLGFNQIIIGQAAGGGTEAVGELHVAGRIESTVSPFSGLGRTLAVGLASGGFLDGPATASGYATIGQMDADWVDVGLAAAQSGAARGVLEIGSGLIASARVGRTAGDADAEGTLITGGDIQRVEVGVSVSEAHFGEPYAVGEAVGSVTAAGVAQFVIVGSVSSDGTATGYLEVEGVTRGPGLPSPLVRVGINDRGAGTADGHMVVRSGGIDASEVRVGWLNGRATSSADGDVTGLLESTGDVKTTSFIGDVVGVGNIYSSGHADGTWILHDATYTSPRLTVGLSEGAGTATGLVHLDRTLVDVLDLTLGDGATIELEVQGAARGTEYSAIDADVAKLNGVLAVSFLGPATLGVYDVIVSNGIDGILGEFDAVEIAGLAADQQAFWGVEIFGDTNPVEVFRLHIVPEPTSGALLALGLLCLSAPRTRAGRRAGR